MNLPQYKYKDVNFSEVKIDKVDVDKLVTYFDKFDADITNTVDVEVYDEKTPEAEMKKFGRVSYYQGEDFIIKARTTRLNTVPFTYKLHVTVDTPVKGVVRCFIGPKYDEYANAYHVNDNKKKLCSPRCIPI